MLWNFNDISFIPHALVSSTEIVDIPVLMGYTALPERAYDILLNLSDEIPPQADSFKRIIEIVYQAAAAKKIARVHYKTYQDRDFPLKSHNL